MRLVEFLDNRFQELKLQETTKPDKFQLTVDSEMKAVHAVLTTVRTLTRWLLIPKVLGHYCLVVLGLLDKPQPVLIQKLKKDAEVKKTAEVAALKIVNEVTSTDPAS